MFRSLEDSFIDRLRLILLKKWVTLDVYFVNIIIDNYKFKHD